MTVRYNLHSAIGKLMLTLGLCDELAKVGYHSYVHVHVDLCWPVQ